MNTERGLSALTRRGDWAWATSDDKAASLPVATEESEGDDDADSESTVTTLPVVAGSEEAGGGVSSFSMRSERHARTGVCIRENGTSRSSQSKIGYRAESVSSSRLLLLPSKETEAADCAIGA